MAVTKVCPVCGETVIGRSDKIYCSDGCRGHANNEKRRALGKGAMMSLEKGQQRDSVQGILKEISEIDKRGGRRFIKIIGALIRVYKIIYKFGRQN